MSLNYAWPHRLSFLPDIVYGENSEQVLDLYIYGKETGEKEGFVQHTKANKTLIFIHGGGWIEGDKSSQSRFIFNYLAHGWNVVNIGYRLGKGTAPEAVTDVLLAFKWVAKHAKHYNIDATNLVISGVSAGGHLALLAGFLNSTPVNSSKSVDAGIRINCIVNWFGISDIVKLENYLSQQSTIQNFALSWIGDKARVAEIGRHFSPLNFIHKNAPPTISIHGNEDRVVPKEQSVGLHKELEEKGIPNKLVVLPGGNHGGFTDKQWQESYEEVLAFIEMHTF